MTRVYENNIIIKRQNADGLENENEFDITMR